MRDFHFILMDLDDTVLDFHKAEHESLIKTLREYGYELTEEDVARYSAINAWHWKQLELGVFTREQVLVGRFARFLLTLGSDADAEAVCRRYEYGLRFEPHLMPGAKDCLTALKAAGKQLYAVSNGSTAVQESRLALSGLDAYFDGVFVSEHMGAEKPTTAYFDKVFAAIPGFEKEHACIVGDSLSSDIKGGKNAGITTIWLRPYHGTHEANADVDVEISSLSELVPLLLGNPSK